MHFGCYELNDARRAFRFAEQRPDHFLRAPLLRGYYKELTKVVGTQWERAKAYLHLRGNSVSSFRCPAGLQL